MSQNSTQAVHVLIQISNTKYQLPGSNNTYVDLVDDEDVKLMFDEWAEYLEEIGKAARNAKLHIYVDYSEKPRNAEMGMPSGGHAHAALGLDTISETASADTPVARAPPPPTAMEARNSEERLSQENSPMGQSSTSFASRHMRYIHSPHLHIMHLVPNVCFCKQPAFRHCFTLICRSHHCLFQMPAAQFVHLSMLHTATRSCQSALSFLSPLYDHV